MTVHMCEADISSLPGTFGLEDIHPRIDAPASSICTVMSELRRTGKIRRLRRNVYRRVAAPVNRRWSEP